MDGVRLTPPTVLGTATAPQHRSARDLPATIPTDILLVVAQNGRKIAYHFPPSPLSDKIHGIHQQVLADLLLPKPALFEQLFDLTLGDHRLIGWPVSLPLTPIVTAELPVRNNTTKGSAASSVGVCASATTPTSPPVSVAPSYSSTSALVELSVVFILDAQPSADDDVRYERAIAGCKSAADQLSHALQREEAYSGIVSLHMGSSDSADGVGGHSATGGKETSASDAMTPFASGFEGSCCTPSATADSCTTASPAAPESVGAKGGGNETQLGTVLRSALQALQNDHQVVLRVGACSDVSICAPLPPPPPPRLAAVSGGMPPPPALRPYLALMPLDDPSTIAATLPLDASPLLVRLIQVANPLRSLEELADETGIAMSVLFSLVGHLQLWGKVRVIHPLTLDSVLCVDADAPSEPNEELRSLLADTMEVSYEQLLSLFASAQRFGSIIRAAETLHLAKRQLVQITIALLKYDVLRQLHTYVYLVSEPPEPPASAAEDDPALARWRLLRRLRPMLHGEHQIEEIVWQERVSRDAIEDMLHAYDEHLVVLNTLTVERYTFD